MLCPQIPALVHPPTVCTALSPSSKRSLAYRRRHGALSTLHGAIRGEGGRQKKKSTRGRKQVRVGNKGRATKKKKRVRGIEKVYQRFWMKIKGGGGRGRGVHHVLLLTRCWQCACSRVGDSVSVSNSRRSRSHTGRHAFK